MTDDMATTLRGTQTSDSRQLNEGHGWIALSQRDELVKYGEGNSIALFAAELKLGVDDIETFAANSLTDSSNDKKCDLVAVDRDSGTIVIAQAYAAIDFASKTQAPLNKTSDLNTAVSWLLSGETDGMPTILKSAALEVRDALDSGDIANIELWSVHNLPENQSIVDELAQVVRTASSIVRTNWPAVQVNVTADEIGKSSINELYARISLPIAVSDTLDFDTLGGYTIEGERWKAYNTAVKLSDLRELWQKYGTDLMSPNVRDYLGVRRTERNINNGIKDTAVAAPGDFFIYNNGITAVVHRFTESVSDGIKRVSVEGLGIVNGGQTTGSIGTLKDGDASNLTSAWVQIRFVTSENGDILENVVKYNNTQNKIEATDFRSRDEVQDRLRNEFAAVPEALYRGARRGGAKDAIKRDRTLLADNSVAQSVAAFHGSPNLAYNDLRQIWEHDSTYARFFNEKLGARHIVFCYSLLKEVERQKVELNSVREEDRTKAQKARAKFYRSRGGIHLLTAAIGNCIETILGRAVTNLFALQFTENLSPAAAMEVWKPVVNICAAFNAQLEPATDLGIKSTDRVKDAIGNFQAMVVAMNDTNEAVFGDFASKVDSK